MAICALNGCDNQAARLSRYCSLACAELEIADLRKLLRESKRVFSHGELVAVGYDGKSSDEAILSLRNPFAERSAAHHAFELLRESGLGGGLHREQVIDRLAAACMEHGVPLRSPRERVRRVLADVRARGFEVSKDDDGRIGLTGRRVDSS